MKKYILHGTHHRADGWTMRDSLAYLTTTEEDAIATCKRNQPQFVVNNVTVEELRQQLQLIEFKLQQTRDIYPS